MRPTRGWRPTGGVQCALLIEKKFDKKITDPAMTSLTTLNLRDNQITDIAPLSALTSLTELVLINNQITDLAPMSALTSLDTLDLSHNQITDLAPLSALNSLRTLILSSNQITDIAPLAALTSLTYLDLNSQLNGRGFSDSDETVVLLKSRGSEVLNFYYHSTESKEKLMERDFPGLFSGLLWNLPSVTALSDSEDEPAPEQ
eukprot:SAG22_NODE_540_length_9301_cov_422.312758_2_plen_202_part_00